MTTTTTMAIASVVPRDAAPARTRKVLHFIPTVVGGGAENFLFSLMHHLRDTRWQQVILAACVHPHEERAEQLRRLGCKVIDLNEPALMSPRLWLAVRQAIAREAPDVVQTWMHHADFIGAVGSYLSGVHNVVWGVRATDMHRNPGDSDLKVKLFEHALRWSSRLLPRKIISNSTVAIDAHCAKFGFPREKMLWIPNGVNAARFAPNETVRAESRAQLGIASDVPVIGFVGRFHPVKDIATFFRAAAKLQATRRDARFVMLGGTGDELYPEAREAFHTLPDRSAVSFVPFGAVAERWYPAFDLFTLCSVSEAFPNVVLEAMATGIPSVCTAAGDCATMLRDIGEVVPVGDAEGIAAGWQKMLALTPTQRAALALECRARAVNDYSMERAARRFIEVYDSLLH